MMGTWRTRAHEPITIRPRNGKASPTAGAMDLSRALGKTRPAGEKPPTMRRRNRSRNRKLYA